MDTENKRQSGAVPESPPVAGSDVDVHFNFGDDWPTAQTSLDGIQFHAERFFRQAFEAGKRSCVITMRQNSPLNINAGTMEIK